MGKITDEFKAFVQTPFQQNMDIFHVFLLTGLVIVSAILWSRVINRLAE
jgi:hypothetical protein